jgi:hypothetical protein
LRISDDEHINEEKTHLLKVFKDNGYNEHLGIKAFQNASKEPRDKEQTNNDVSKVLFPYIHGTTDKLARILRKKKIGETFKPINTIRNSLRSVKDPTDPIEKKGVYMIPCSCGKQYIGKQVVPLGLGFRNMPLISSTITLVPLLWPNTQDKTKHHICIEEAKILARVDHYHNRKFREAIEIEKQPNNLNRDDGWKISQNWIPTLSTRIDSR